MCTSNTERKILEEKYADFIQINPYLNRKLVSFQANKKVPFYNWFGFKEGFSSEMVKYFIQQYPKTKGIVLDPFSGSGTTLFSSSGLGFDALGIEVLPIGSFLLKTRYAAERVERQRFENAINKLKRANFIEYPVSSKISFKHINITKKAFPEDTERKLNGFLNYVFEEKDEEIKQLLLFACFSILEKISYTRKDGQYLRWDARARKGKTTFNKGRVQPFEEALFEKLMIMLSDIKRNRERIKDKSKTPKIDLKTGSSLELLPSLDEKSIDLIISSPPYCNRYDYTRTYALELAFLGVGENEIRSLRQRMLSCTVENKEKIELLRKIYEANGQVDLFNKAEKAFYSNRALQEILGVLERHKNEKKLNNPGIYRMVKNYFYEHAFIIFEMARVLKDGGIVYYVNDNVRYSGENIPVDLILSEFAAAAGLEVKQIYKLKNGKGNSSQQMGVHGREELRKCVYCWRK